MKMSVRAVPIVALALFTLPLYGQSWDALRELKPGDRIAVLDSGGKEYKGELMAVSPEAVALRTQRQETSIERSRVRRVQVRSASRRVRNILIGAGFGVALGLIIDQTLGTYFRNEAGESSAARAGTYAAPIGIFGAIGAALPSYRTVYRVR